MLGVSFWEQAGTGGCSHPEDGQMLGVTSWGRWGVSELLLNCGAAVAGGGEESLLLDSELCHQSLGGFQVDSSRGGFQLGEALGAILLLAPCPSLPGGGWLCLLEAARQKLKCTESFELHQSHPFTCSSLFVGTGSCSWVTHGSFSHSWPPQLEQQCLHPLTLR